MEGAPSRGMLFSKSLLKQSQFSVKYEAGEMSAIF